MTKTCFFIIFSVWLVARAVHIITLKFVLTVTKDVYLALKLLALNAFKGIMFIKINVLPSVIMLGKDSQQ